MRTSGAGVQIGGATLLSLALVVSIALPAQAGLRTEVEHTFTAEPEAGVLRIETDMVLTNTTPNRVTDQGTTRFYYDRIEIYLPKSAEEVQASSGGRSLSLALRSPEVEDDVEGWQIATIRFGRRLFFKQSISIHMEYAVRGDEPRTESQFRINPAYVSFPVAAWGDPGLVDVHVVVPADFEMTFFGSSEYSTIRDGDTITHSATGLEDVEGFFSYAVGTHERAMTTDEVQVDEITITVRGWPGDPWWNDEVLESVEVGLPLLLDLVGLDWDAGAPLSIRESADVVWSGYAGWYTKDANEIEIGEWVDPWLVLHELSHVWFNDDLFVERWINEGLADEFSLRVTVEAGLAEERDLRVMTTPAGHPLILRLNDWTVPDVDEFDNLDALDVYEVAGYEMSLWVIQEITEEIGIEGMRDVIEAAAMDRIAYQGEPVPETVAGSDDWRRFLDLLQEIGGSEAAEELFFVWVTDTSLRERGEARAEYDRIEAAAGGWELPFYVRSKMSDWDFDAALEALAEIEALLEQRTAIEDTYEILGIATSSTLEDAFETSEESMATATGVADNLLDASTEVLEIKDAVGTERRFFERIGLIGDDLDAEYQDAVDALLEEDFEAVTAEAAEAALILADAQGQGILIVSISGALLVLIVGAGVVMIRRRRPISTDPQLEVE